VRFGQQDRYSSKRYNTLRRSGQQAERELFHARVDRMIDVPSRGAAQRSPAAAIRA
jgi:hypothetical protein